MSRESKLELSDLVNNDPFKLNFYLTYLFHQFYRNVPDQSNDKNKIKNNR
ncbi:hypothetical protein (plasmid) [Metabacillus dongyingensis]|nr:hypothetical protein [Metabacillus dongyingensis]